MRAETLVPALTALLLTLSASLAYARTAELARSYHPLELPGAPASVIPTDLDGDGRVDLAVVVAITAWDQIGTVESTYLDEVDELVEVLTIVPALLDRRELRIFLGRPEGGFAPAFEPLVLEPRVLSIEAGPPGLPLVALTDDGLEAIRLEPEAESQRVGFEPLIRERPVLAGSRHFVPRLGMVVDLDGDRRKDVLFPAEDGAAVYLSGPEGLASTPAARIAYGREDHAQREGVVRFYPLPEVRDLDGDALPDLLLRHPTRGANLPRVARGLGQGRFAPVMAPLGEIEARDAEGGPPVVFVGDLDGDGRAEYVSQEEKKPEGDGLREELRHAKRPPQLYRLYHSRPALARESQPYQQLEAVGYAFEGSEEVPLPGGFQDLNGDGRLDLVTLTLDFSVLQAVRILATRRLSVGLDFHVFCQGEDGRLLLVSGLDLSGKLNLDLNHLRIGRLTQFAGDFDGDGRAEFVQMGRGKKVTVHRGRADCSYPSAPDLTIDLEAAPSDLALVEVRDLDGDDLADLLVIQPRKTTEPGTTAPVRLDLYLSGGAP